MIAKWFNRFSLILTSIWLLSLSPALEADLFYSVDTNTDELVQIDTTNGNVTVIGNLGFDAYDIDLALLEDVLYGVETTFTIRAELYQIDRSSGFADKLGDDLNAVGVPVLNAEGLIDSQGSLYVSFETSTNTNSNRLGVLDLDGSISRVKSIDVDMDGLARDAADQIFAIDADTGVDRFFLYLIDPTRMLGSDSGLGSSRLINDLSFVGTSLYAIDWANPRIHRLDPATGEVINSIELTRPGRYSGLALVSDRLSLFQCSDSSFLNVQRAYIAYYGRPGDFAGLDYWCQRLDNEGGNLDSIMEAFGVSEEFLREYGHLSDEDLIYSIYNQLFNREPDPAGFQFYLNNLTSGRMSLQTITLSVLFGASGTDVNILAYKESIALYHVSEELIAINAGQNGVHDLIYWILDDVVDFQTQQDAVATIDFYFNE